MRLLLNIDYILSECLQKVGFLNFKYKKLHNYYRLRSFLVVIDPSKGRVTVIAGAATRDALSEAMEVAFDFAMNKFF
jgi:hypothetical protein